MSYLRDVYNSAYRSLALALQNLSTSLESTFRDGSLVELVVIPISSKGLDGNVGNISNGNGYYSDSPVRVANMPWGGFYPQIDAKRRIHHNHYHGHNTAIARAIYKARGSTRENRVPVDILKVKRVKGGTQVTSRKVDFKRHSSLFKH